MGAILTRRNFIQGDLRIMEGECAFYLSILTMNDEVVRFNKEENRLM